MVPLVIHCITWVRGAGREITVPLSPVTPSEAPCCRCRFCGNKTILESGNWEYLKTHSSLVIHICFNLSGVRELIASASHPCTVSLLEKFPSHWTPTHLSVYILHILYLESTVPVIQSQCFQDLPKSSQPSGPGKPLLARRSQPCSGPEGSKLCSGIFAAYGRLGDAPHQRWPCPSPWTLLSVLFYMAKGLSRCDEVNDLRWGDHPGLVRGQGLITRVLKRGRQGSELGMWGRQRKRDGEGGLRLLHHCLEDGGRRPKPEQACGP